MHKVLQTLTELLIIPFPLSPAVRVKTPSFQCQYFYCTSLPGTVSVYKMEITASLKVSASIKNKILLNRVLSSIYSGSG